MTDKIGEPLNDPGQASEGQVAILDHALWARLDSATGVEDTAVIWLPLLCSTIEGAVSGAVVLGDPEAKDYAPVCVWPDGHRPGHTLSAAAELALQEQRTVVRRAEAKEPSGDGACCIAQPIIHDGEPHGVVAVGLRDWSDSTIRTVLRQIQWGIKWLSSALYRRDYDELRRVRKQISSALDVIAATVDREGVEEAGRALATELAERLSCDRVSVGLLRSQHIRVIALSHSAQFGRQMDLVRAIALAMEEATDQGMIVMVPGGFEGVSQVAHAQRKLAAKNEGGAVLTVPLIGDELPVGAITLERSADKPFNEAEIDLVESVACAVAGALRDKYQNDRWIVTKLTQSLWRQIVRLLGPHYIGRKLATAAVLAAIALCYFATGPYRISANSTIEGKIRRVIVAPFDGYIIAEGARAGDTVKAGDVVAELDSSELRLEHGRWQATYAQHHKEYDNATAQADRAQANIIAAQMQQDRAQLKLLDEQIARTRLRAPFDGVVVEGDVSQRIGSAVSRGDKLFEVAPLDRYRLNLRVDEADIGAIAAGQQGHVLLAARPESAIEFIVRRITPVTETGEGHNFYRVEAELRGPVDLLRPGMEGVAKVDVGERRLVWIWSRGLISYLRIKLWSYWPY